MSTIPASAIVNITPGVLSAGGNALNLIGLMLTNNPRVPIGTVISLSGPDDVNAYFGPSSDEAAKATVYFNGFNGSTQLPGSVLFAQYPTAAVSAYLRSGPVGSEYTLAQLQALTGTLSIIVDGVLRDGGTINLFAAASFSSAAEIIEDALNTTATTEADFTGDISGSTLNVSAMNSGVIAVGQTVRGTGVEDGTLIIAFGSGSGQTGTYTLSNSQTVSSEAMTTEATPVTVNYDSVSEAFNILSGATGVASTIQFAIGTLAAPLLMTSQTGAVLSAGAAPAVPAPFMNGIVSQTQNWATFETLFDPDNGSGNDQKFAFAQWNNGRNNRFAYICEDTDLSPTVNVPATASLGQRIKNANLSGTCLIFNIAGGSPLAAFASGCAASLDYDATNGRTTFDFLSQDGLIASVTDETIGDNLIANGYNFYGAYATANQGFVFFNPGSVSGKFLWLDSYINQIQLNNSFQLALMTYLTNIKSVPYNAAGNSSIEAALADPINAGLNFGIFRPGVPLSASQANSVNNAAGAQISSTLQARGWYLQIGQATPQVRQQRGSPPINFWYMDGESVQKLSMNSVVVQ